MSLHAPAMCKEQPKLMQAHAHLSVHAVIDTHTAYIDKAFKTHLHLQAQRAKFHTIQIQMKCKLPFLQHGCSATLYIMSSVDIGNI